MPDATEWLVEYLDSESETRYERIADRDDAIEYLHQLVGQGKTAFLYQRVPFEVQIGVTVKAPRRRRKNSPPADKPGSDTPTGPGNGEAGELRGAASPQAEETIKDAVAQETAVSPVVVTAGNPVSPYSCEARFDGGPVCHGPAEFDPVSRGWFCGLHALIPESNRRELHRRHSSRNRPVRVAHAG